MSRRIIGRTIAGFSLLVAGCGTGAPRVPLPATEVVGAARSCVQVQAIASTRVLDDRTIDFVMRDGTVLRNVLPNGCPMLGFERAFSYTLSISQLCSVDIITVIRQSGDTLPGARCSLGQFVPIAPPPRQ